MFVEAAAYQTVGDWGYLPSKDWISPWANKLNSDVLNGISDLKTSLDNSKQETQQIIDGYYKDIY